MAPVGKNTLPDCTQLEDLPSPAFHHILQRACTRSTPGVCILSRVCKGLQAAAAAAAVPVHVQLGCHRNPLAADKGRTLMGQVYCSSSEPHVPQQLWAPQRQQHQQQHQQQQQGPLQRTPCAREASAVNWLRRHSGTVHSLSIYSEQPDPSSAVAILDALGPGVAAPTASPAPAAAGAQGGVHIPPPPLQRLQLQGYLPLPSLTTSLAPFQHLQVLHLATPGSPLTYPTTGLSPTTMSRLCTALSGLQHLQRLALQLYVHLPEGSAQQLVSSLPCGLQAVVLHLATPQQVCSSSSSFNRLPHLQTADLVNVDFVESTTSSSSSSSSSRGDSNPGDAQQRQEGGAASTSTPQQQLGLPALTALSIKCHSSAAVIPGAQHLQHLQLSGACAPPTFKQLRGCRQLQHLHLCRLHGPPDVDAMSALTQLRRLRLETPAWLPAAATWAAALAALPALQQLEVNVEALEQIPAATWLPYMASLVLVILFSEGSPLRLDGLQGLAHVVNSSTYESQERAGGCSMASCSSMASAGSMHASSSTSTTSSSSSAGLQMEGGARADSLGSEGTIVSMDWNVGGFIAPDSSMDSVGSGRYSSSGNQFVGISCSTLKPATINNTNNSSSGSNSSGLNSTQVGAGLRLKEVRLAACQEAPATSSSGALCSSGHGTLARRERLHVAAGALQLLLPTVAVCVTSDASVCPWWLGEEAVVSW